PDVLGRLFNELSFMGVPPYYVFHCRPTLGNRAYTLPLEQAYEIFEAGRTRVSGLGKRARFVMSHSTGKIEVVGLTQRHICFRYQRAAVNENSARFLVFKRNPEAYWFDDYNELVDEGSILGPEGLEEWTLDGVLNPA
ncbi:MAG: KamA family radical SAM protein, partial [Nitrospinaceae bacterium]